MRVAVGQHHDVARVQPQRRFAVDGNPAFALDEQVVLDDVLGTRHHGRRELVRSRRLGHPLAAAAHVEENRTPQPDAAQHVGERIDARHRAATIGLADARANRRDAR